MMSSASTSAQAQFLDAKLAEPIEVTDKMVQLDSLSSADPFTLHKISNTVAKSEKEVCLTCKFWNKTKDRLGLKGDSIATEGECRFNPPERVEWDHSAQFPVVSPYWWCGKFERAEDVPVSIDTTPAPVGAAESSSSTP